MSALGWARRGALLGLLLVACVEPITDEDGEGSPPVLAGVQPCLRLQDCPDGVRQRVHVRYSAFDPDCDLDGGAVSLAVDGLVVDSHPLGGDCSIDGSFGFPTEALPGEGLALQVWIRDGAGRLDLGPEGTWLVPDESNCPEQE